MAHIIDSYSESNYSQSAKLAAVNGSGTALGQSFTADGSQVVSVVLYLAKNGTPSATTVSKIYAHAGTFGSTSTPTGTALATSDTFNISTLTTTLTLMTFTFSGVNQIVLTNGQNYVVTIESSSSDGSNSVVVGEDATSITAAGNASQFISSWGYNPAIDLCFYVYGFSPPTLTGISQLTGVGSLTL